MPSRQLHIEPLNAPGLVVATEPAGGALAVDGAVSQPDADEVVAAQSHLPVMASGGEPL